MNPEYIDSLLPASGEPTLQWLAFLVIITFIPLITLTTTPFLRIVIVMYLMRQAIGVQQSPPNIVLTGLSLILTFFVMQPTLATINETAITPLVRKEATLGEAMSYSYEPLRDNMLERVDERDIQFFYELTEEEMPTTVEELKFIHLLSAHVLSELRVAFSLGFLIYIPFLVIDLIITNILLALGMMMLNPTIISLPFKLMIFVAVDGWTLIIQGLVKSFR